MDEPVCGSGFAEVISRKCLRKSFAEVCAEVFRGSVLGGEWGVFAEAFCGRVCGSVPRKCSRKIRGRGFIAGQCLDGAVQGMHRPYLP